MQTLWTLIGSDICTSWFSSRSSRHNRASADASQFVIAPIFIYFYNKQSANPRFTTFDIVNPPLRLPPSYMQNLSVLESLGFQPVAHLFGGALATNLCTVLTLYVNRREREIATVVHMLCEVPPATRVLHTYAEFCTEFDDGHEVNTSNSNQPALFAVVPEKQILRLPHLTNLQHLYEVHRALTVSGWARINGWHFPDRKLMS